MTTLHIEHEITDYETWRSAFDAFAQVRQEAGVIGERVSRPVDDEQYIVVGLDFDSTDHAEAFLSFLQTQVWASATSAPALAGRPKAAIVELG
ncbi:MAG: hypothetical protein ACT4OV_01520 [Microthrixaceae bacterium]